MFNPIPAHPHRFQTRPRLVPVTCKPIPACTRQFQNRPRP